MQTIISHNFTAGQRALDWKQTHIRDNFGLFWKSNNNHHFFASILYIFVQQLKKPYKVFSFTIQTLRLFFIANRTLFIKLA